MTEFFDVRLEGFDEVLSVPDNQPLLDSILAAGFKQRYSCRNGVCQICDAELFSGSVWQRYPQKRVCLQKGQTTPELIYLCTAFPRTDLELRLIRFQPPSRAGI